MDFLNTLSELWNTPSVDSSALLSEQSVGELLRNSVETGLVKYQEELAQVLTEYKYDVTFGLNGLVYAVKDSSDNYVDENGMSVTPTFVNGIPTLDSLIGTVDKQEILTDESDSADYNIRFSSLDARTTTEDGSDIAFMRIVTNDIHKKVVFPSFTSSPAPGISNSKFKQFILTQLSIPSQERMQIVETNEDFQVLFFGKKAEVLQLGGILKNTLENPWSMNMLFLWDELMRGSKLVENGYILQVYADGELYTGYPFNFQRSKVAPNDFLVTFNFSLIVKDRVSTITSSNMTPTNKVVSVTNTNSKITNSKALNNANLFVISPFTPPLDSGVYLNEIIYNVGPPPPM